MRVPVQIPRWFVGLTLALLPVPALAQVAVIVTPDGTVEPVRTQFTSGYSATFRVQNETPGSGSTVFQITCNTHGPVACDSIRPTSVTIANGSGHAFQNVTAYYKVSASGTAQLVGKATSGTVSDTGYRVVPIDRPPGAPRIAESYWQDSVQALGRCAANCFAAVYSQSTVPYFTLDAARGVTLTYQGDRVAPKTFVMFDIYPDTTLAAPSEYQLGLKFGSIQYPFVNGDTVLHFAPDTANATKPHRIAGQFASDSTVNFGHGVAFPLEIQIAAKISGTLYTNRITTQYLSVNEVTSPIARGWTVAGVQRAWVQSNGSLLITDGSGNATYFGKDGSNFVTPTGEFSNVSSVVGGWVRAYPDSLKIFFNSGGGIADSVKDRFGNRTWYQYDGSGRLQYIWDPIMQLITLTYGTNGLSSITDASGRVTRITVQSNKTLTAIIDPDSISTSFSYDGTGRLSTITDRNGAVTTLAYDTQSGKLFTVTHPAIPVFGAGTVSPVDTLFNWQKRSVPYSSTLGTAAKMAKSDTVYGRLVDPKSDSTRFTVSRWGQPKQLWNALHKLTTVRYSAAGLPDSVVGPGYGSTSDRTVYSSDGLPTAIYSAAGDSTLITYAGWAQPATVSNRGSDSTRYYVGTSGRVDSIAVGGPTIQRISYDSRGRVTMVKNATGDTLQAVFYRVNGYQNKQAIIQPGPRITRLIHDTYGRLSAVRDSSANLPDAFTWYSIVNRVDSTQSAAGWKTRYKYDGLYLRRVILPNGARDSTDYNAWGLPILHVDPKNSSETFAYNKDGLMVRTVTRRGLNIDMAYDSLHRLTQRVGTSTVSWSYDDDSLKVMSTSPQESNTTYSNLRGQPLKVVTVLAGHSYAQNYYYRPAGLLDSLKVGVASDSFIVRSYDYDVLSGVITSMKLRSQTTNFDYDPNLNVLRVTYPFTTGKDSLVRSGTDAPNQRLTDSANTNLLERWLGYNTVGQIDRHLRFTAKLGRWFTYDTLGQLRRGFNTIRDPSATLPTGCPKRDFGMSGTCTPTADYDTLGTVKLYLYDAIGNRTEDSASYDATGTRIQGFNKCGYSTDADGNTTARVSGTYTCPAPIDSLVWNAEGQLTRLVLPGGVKIAYYYDASGHVVRKDSAGIARAYYLWAGDHLFAELNNSATAKTAEYAYYPGIDHPEAFILGQAIYRTRVDGLGSVIALTDTAGRLKRLYSYDDWGLDVGGGYDSVSANGRDRARWKGALWMGPEADLYFMRNRWYEPATGRFLSEDPLPTSANLYAFADNDPVGGSDPTGLQGCTTAKRPCRSIIAFNYPPVPAPEATVFVYEVEWLASNPGAELFRPRQGGGSANKPRPMKPRDTGKNQVDIAFLYKPEWAACNMKSIQASGPMVTWGGRPLANGVFEGTFYAFRAPYRLFGITLTDRVAIYLGHYVGPTRWSLEVPVTKEAKAEIICGTGYGFLRVFP